MGIVHHSNYLKYFELGRLEWLSKIGISYSKIENDGIIMPVVNASLDYKAFAFFDDELTIRIKLITPPTSRIIWPFRTGQTQELRSPFPFPIRCPCSFL